MSTICATEFKALLQNAHPIESDDLGLKVVRLQNGNFLKIYRRKHLLFSAPRPLPSEHFANDAQRLNARGITRPEVIELLCIPDRHLNAMRYRPLPGESLRNHWRQLDAEERAIGTHQLDAPLARLHHSGVYFRSLHLGNVPRLPDGTLGLIDLPDNHPLSPEKRKRNIQHILRYPGDTTWLTQQHRQDWIAGYALGLPGLLLAPEFLLQRDASFRPLLWMEALRQALEAPWTGHGYDRNFVFDIPGRRGLLSDPHNIVLAALLELGIVSRALWSLMYLLSLVYCLQLLHLPSLQITSALLIYGLAEGSSFLARPNESWLIIWIPLALIAVLSITQRGLPNR